MQTVFRKGEGEELILFFTGWGMDERPTNHLSANGRDLLTVFQYNDPTPLPYDLINRYRVLYLAGWSMGVWAAEHFLKNSSLCFKKATAVNGTSAPIDNQFGIPYTMAEGTMAGLSDENMRRFLLRTCGGKAAFERLAPALPNRKTEECKEELAFIIGSSAYPNPSLRWDSAIVSSKDAIIPPAHQAAFWQTCSPDTKIIPTETPHYPFFHLNRWSQLLDIDE